MPKAKNGKPTAISRRQAMAFSATAGASAESVKPATTHGAPKKKNAPTAVSTTRFQRAAIQTALSARAGSFAPRLCPTIAAAALAIPQDGRSPKITTRMPIV